MSDRRQKLLQGIDLATSSGIEIGPLAWPIIAKTDGDVTYVDWTDTETLRQKYADDPNVDIDRIVKVDAIWGEKTLGEAVGRDRRFDYIIASHVIEHVPDLIAWIRELLGVLKDTGEVRLAVPDKRFTFDFLRRETTLPDVLAAHLHGARKPMTGPVLDHFINYINLDWLGIWHKTVDLSTLRPDPARVPLAVDMAKRAMGDQYIDVHCWVFTPVSLARLMEQLVSAGFLDCRCTSFFDTAEDNMEFFVGLRLELDRAAAVASWRQVYEEAMQGSARILSDLEGALARIELDRTERELGTIVSKLAEAEHAGAAANTRIQETEGNITAMAARLAEAERQISALKQSRSWRITAPLRGMSTLLGRR